MRTRKVRVVTLYTEIVERISVIEIPLNETNESVIRKIEGKISPDKEQTLEEDVFDISAKVVSIIDFK